MIGSVFSAYFIIVANSWMQHPVGVEMVDGRPVMTDAWAVFTNNTALVAVPPHTLFGALAVAGASCWVSPGTTSGAAATMALMWWARTASWFPARPQSRAVTKRLHRMDDILANWCSGGHDLLRRNGHHR